MNDNAAWEAVVARDASRDGQLIYAVETTGIFCRPSCPSRLPLRHNVRFFAEPEAAEKAGFRACMRCRPQRGETARADEIVLRATAYLDRHLDEPVTLEALGTAVGVSPFHLQRTFTRGTGVSPRDYVRARRIERLKRSLAGGDDVTTAIYAAGYGSSSRVYEQSDAELGMTPGSWGRGGRGMRIRFTIAACPLGRVLVAASSRGVCSVRLGNHDAELEAELRRELPAAVVERDDAALAGNLAAVVAHIEGKPRPRPLPLDVQATAFQRRVWRALSAIPAGTTLSYGEVAAALGQPKATRAVARACATNPVAVVVPCHRVVREGGALGGYRWGLERKAKLLAGERARRKA